MDTSPARYIDAARPGRNDPWRYLLTLVLAFILAQLGGVLLALFAFLAAGVPNLTDLPEPLLLGVQLLSTAFLIAGLWIGLRWLHKRRWKSLINPASSFRWKLFAVSALAWLVISAAADGVLALVQPGNYALGFDPARFIPYALVALALLPLQVAAEELLFRGYLTQGFGLAGGYWAALLAPALIFGLLHITNPEVQAYGAGFMLPMYIGIGLLLGWVTLRSAGLETALGLHLANNLYGTLLVSAPVSALPAPALVRIAEYNAPASLAAFIGMVGLYVLLMKSIEGRLAQPATDDR